MLQFADVCAYVIKKHFDKDERFVGLATKINEILVRHS